MFIIGKFLQAFVLPPGVFIVGLIALAALSARARRKAAAILAGLMAAILYACSIDPCAAAMSGTLEGRWPPLESPGVAVERGATDVVALGGGLLPESPEYAGKASLTGTSALRAAAAFRIARETGLPLLFSGGGRRRDEESEAEAARRFWIGLGADPSRIRIETESRDTDENAKFVAAMVGRGPVVLVTSAYHMPRAVLAFRKAGIEVIPAPTDYRSDWKAPFHNVGFQGWLPNARNLETTAYAIHEWIGLLYYTVK
jgi:uncharacterized SAM-binding protein YcdF (DUF218 family)